MIFLVVNHFTKIELVYQNHFTKLLVLIFVYFLIEKLVNLIIYLDWFPFGLWYLLSVQDISSKYLYHHKQAIPCYSLDLLTRLELNPYFYHSNVSKYLLLWVYDFVSSDTKVINLNHFFWYDYQHLIINRLNLLNFTLCHVHP